mgnify:FL=1
MNRRVVITGLGVACPLGNSVSVLWDALQSQQSGVARLESLPAVGDRVVFGGECRDFTGEIDNFGPLEKELKKTIRKALKVMCRETMMAIACSQQAIEDARATSAGMDPERCGVVFGSDYMLSPPDDFVDGMLKCGAGEGKFAYSQWGSAGLSAMSPLWMLKFLPNMPGSHIAIFNDFRGPNNSLTMREISGILAIREAMQTIARGHADLMVAGATGTRIHSFKTLHALQTEQLASPECEPAEASRPFDAHRTGMVVGEGAGAIVLEELESARRRGAKIYGEILGAGSSSVADSQLRGNQRQALANAARVALGEAGIAPPDCGHINAHGLGTKAGDIAEAAAIGDVFGETASGVPTVGVKSYFGNLGAGSGVVELVASVRALETETLFGTRNFSTPDPECPLKVSGQNNLPVGGSFLKLSVTPQGQAAAVVVGRV